MKNSQHTSSDLYLIAFCKGDNTAITTQYKCWLPELYLIAYRYTKNQEQSEDIVADFKQARSQRALAASAKAKAK